MYISPLINQLLVNADNRCKLICESKISTASGHYTLHFEDVLNPPNTSRDIYADRSYVNHKCKERLESDGYRMHIQRKGDKDKLLSEAQQRRNRRIAIPHLRRLCLRRHGATGRQDAAFEWTGMRHAASEVEGCYLQFAPPLLSQRGHIFGVLAPTFRLGYRKRSFCTGK